MLRINVPLLQSETQKVISLRDPNYQQLTELGAFVQTYQTPHEFEPVAQKMSSGFTNFLTILKFLGFKYFTSIIKRIKMSSNIRVSMLIENPLSDF